MGGQNKKSTKKFEKNHLKDTIERRKEFAKIKQRQQIKAKKKARHVSDYGKVSDGEESDKPKAHGRNTAVEESLKDMTMDEFFQGDFDIPEPKKRSGKQSGVKSTTGKRKRDEENVDEQDDSGSGSSDLGADHTPDDESASQSDREDRRGAHKEDLDALAQKDPEFYKYLRENDAELLDFAEDGDLAEVDELSEDDVPKKKRRKGKIPQGAEEEQEDETEVTLMTVKKWKIALAEQHSLRATRQVVLAFRAAAHSSEEDEKQYKYSITSPDVYHQLLVTALKHIPDVLAHHLPVKEIASGKIRVPTDSKKYKTLAPLLKSHAASVHHLLQNLSDEATIKLTLTSIMPFLPYILSFKKALKNLVKTIVGIWSDPSSSEATRLNSFLLIRRLMVISDASLREAVLKTTYQGLVKGSRATTIHTLPGVNLMKNTASELWGLDPNLGYTTGFTYIRQLAIHLRASITHPTKDSYKVIYNWQYMHSLDFWSRVLSHHCSTTTNPLLKKPHDSPLHPLIYPLVQITLGALRLIPTPAYFPLRFHLTRSLLRLSRSTNTYIPLAPSLLEVLSSPELKKPPKPSTLRPLDFRTAIRAPKSYLRTRIYQDGVGEQLAELLAEFFAVWARNIAFPELCIPPRVLLKRWLKEVSSPLPSRAPPGSSASAKSRGRGNKNQKLNASISLLLQKLDANAAFVEERRRKVDFAPSDRSQVEAFLREVAWEDMPLGAFVVGERRRKAEREAVLEEGRRREEDRRKTDHEEKRGGDEGEVLGEDSEDGMEADEEEEDMDDE